MKIISIKNLIPKQATHPGEHLKDEIEARGIKQNDLAVDLDLPKSTISEIIRGKKPVNPDIALRLEKVLGISAKFWMNAQSNYEIDQRRVKEKHIEYEKNNEIWKVIKSYIDLSFFKKTGVIVDDLKQNIEQIFKIFDVQSLDGFVGVFASAEAEYRYRKSKKSNVERNNLVCWVNLAKYRAKELYVPEFNHLEKDSVFNDVKNILYRNEKTILEDIKNVLNTYGIKFLFIENPKKCAVEGVSFWSEGNPAVCLSLRNKDVDSFAFTLFHELSHIYLHLINNNEKEYINRAEKDLKEEQEADSLASEKLIPKEIWEKLRNIDFYDEILVKDAAERYKIHPAILQGRFSNDTQNYKIRKIDGRLSPFQK